MKKNLLAFLLLAVALVGCQQNGYKIKGTAEGFADGDTLLLITDFATGTPSDTLIVNNGRFEHSGQVDSVDICAIYSLANPEAGTDFLLEPGTITISLSQEPGMSRVGGTKANEGWQQLNDMVAGYGERMQQLTNQALSAEPDTDAQVALYEQMARMEYEMGQKVVEIAEKNLDNELGYFLVLNYMNDAALPAEKRLELMDRLPASSQQRGALKQLRSEMQQVQDSPGEGMPFGDYTLSTPSGDQLRLLDEVARHRFTIIDFWASWCGPCMREIPHLKQLYAEYSPKGFGIIGISLDEDRDAWVKAVTSEKLQWPQVSDLKGWKCEPARALGVEAIPCFYVLDENGTILAEKLDGSQLEQFLILTMSKIAP
ncbi:MAG: AhpC/TSA family protein [Prevotella sp.]|nr:AhpC/TSA family protein [Prevotella sp.]